MGHAVKSGRRRQRLVLALLVVLSLTAACGGDDGAADEAAGDVDAYCALVSEAKALSGHVAETEDPAELEQLTGEQLVLAEQLRSVAPSELQESYDVVVDVLREYQTVASVYGWELERMVTDGVFSDLASYPGLDEANAAIDAHDTATCGATAGG